MAVVAQADASAVFDLKSAALTLIALVLKTTDLALFAHALELRFGDAPGLFDHDPVTIDLSVLHDAPEPIDFTVLSTLLRRYKMVPVAAKGGNSTQMAAAQAAGLADAHGLVGAGAPPRIETVVQEVVREVQVSSGVNATLVIDKPLRSGQQVYAKGADLVVLAAVSFGAEVIADGHIHVYAPLRGRAIAGARGNTGARIFTTCLEPQLVSIAGIYRTAETELPADVAGRAAQVRLDGERLVIEALKA